nr:hypothetical protein CFP56_57654 [Quercus suber]
MQRGEVWASDSLAASLAQSSNRQQYKTRSDICSGVSCTGGRGLSPATSDLPETCSADCPSPECQGLEVMSALGIKTIPEIWLSSGDDLESRIGLGLPVFAHLMDSFDLV